jgi:ubiquinone/menaquinone biosynthesis C-methylase UbiE
VGSEKIKKDNHFPTFVFNNIFRKLFENPNKYRQYVSQDQVVADLGCGPGFFTFPLADAIGKNGRIYAVDSDERAVRAVEKKAVKKGYTNIDAHTSSAARLGFIADDSVDFVLADGLICCIAPQDHIGAVNEIKRILKTDGKALLITSTSSMSYVNDAEWESILKEFNVEQRNYSPYKGNRMAIVTIADR